MGKTKTDHHNDGQTDKANGDYSPPHSVAEEFGGFCGVGSKSYSEMHEDNAAYQSGRDNVD